MLETTSVEVITRRLGALPGREPRVVVSGNFATPTVLVDALGSALERCRVFALNAQAGFAQHDGFISETPFVGPGMRHDPRLEYLPMRLSLVPRLFDLVRPVDAVLLHTSVPRGDTVSLGIEVNILPAAIERVRARGGLVVAQMNPHMPFTFGDSEIPDAWIDLAVEVDEPLGSPAPRPPTRPRAGSASRWPASPTTAATIQLGIGEIPDTAARALVARRGLGVWTELVGDGVLGLERAGALDPDRPMRASFLFGSPELYDWADGNARLEMVRTEIMNDPARIAANPAMLSINTALQVDLFAQANATFVLGQVYSGFGGQPDFVTGALHSPGGHAVVALRSWHDKSDSSTVLPVLTSPVTSFQHSAIVSEHGCAEMFGRSGPSQARLLIEQVADPRARAALAEAGGSLGLFRAATGVP